MKEITIKVKGMMCGGCENRVQNALSDIEEIEIIEASHVDGTVKVISNGEINIDNIKQIIEDLGFEIE